MAFPTQNALSFVGSIGGNRIRMSLWLRASLKYPIASFKILNPWIGKALHQDSCGTCQVNTGFFGQPTECSDMRSELLDWHQLQFVDIRCLPRMSQQHQILQKLESQLLSLGLRLGYLWHVLSPDCSGSRGCVV